MAAGDPGVLKRNFSATAIETTLVNSISSASTGDTTTSVSVVSVSGYPTAPFTLILAPDTNKEEVVTCISVVGTTLQIIRGQDSTLAVSHTAGTSVRHGVSGRDFKEEQTHIAARGYDADTAILANAGQTHVHGLQTGDGSVVGSTQQVTLTRKTLTTPTINGATITGAVTSSATITGGTLTGAVVTGLSTPSAPSDASTKGYVDGLITTNAAYATAAATSATSAATSATSSATSAAAAATSATSAATSATSASNSATASATSASAAATSASSAATSAASAAASTSAAAASASAAATSATSASASATAAATSATSAATSASSALTSQTAAATSATSAAASATAAATSATSAAASVSTIASYATAAATSATSAANSATAAATSAASAAASTSAAAASASAAATSATSASTSATSAATSASSAASSQGAAAASASNAANSETSAGNYATLAATSATSASASATAAATSAVSAATSASDAATTYDNFDDRYLGSKSTAPTVDNDGNTLLVGAIYWNSTLNNMYVWSGSTWVQIATTSSYSAPTIGSTVIGSGATVATIDGLTLSGGLATADPTLSLGLATKQYVDNLITGVNFHAPVVAATTANITGTYNNGSSGVGATFTVTATGEHVVDNITLALNNRILIKDQTTQTQNGVYTLTTAGTTGVSAVYTRATDQDNSVAGEMANGDDFNVQGGTVNAGKSFINSTTGTITIGTTNITYSAYYAGLPDQSTNAGKALTTDGTTPSWSTTINGTAIPASKTLVATDSTAFVVPSQTSNSGKFLTTNGTTSSWGTAVTSVAAGSSKITVGGTTSAPTVDLGNSGVTAGSYTLSSITVDNSGRVTAASNGSAGSSGGMTLLASGTFSGSANITGISQSYVDLILVIERAKSTSEYSNGSFYFRPNNYQPGEYAYNYSYFQKSNAGSTWYQSAQTGSNGIFTGNFYTFDGTNERNQNLRIEFYNYTSTLAAKQGIATNWYAGNTTPTYWTIRDYTTAISSIYVQGNSIGTVYYKLYGVK